MSITRRLAHGQAPAVRRQPQRSVPRVDRRVRPECADVQVAATSSAAVRCAQDVQAAVAARHRHMPAQSFFQSSGNCHSQEVATRRLPHTAAMCLGSFDCLDGAASAS